MGLATLQPASVIATATVEPDASVAMMTVAGLPCTVAEPIARTGPRPGCAFARAFEQAMVPPAVPVVVPVPFGAAAAGGTPARVDAGVVPLVVAVDSTENSLPRAREGGARARPQRSRGGDVAEVPERCR